MSQKEGIRETIGMEAKVVEPHVWILTGAMLVNQFLFWRAKDGMIKSMWAMFGLCFICLMGLMTPDAEAMTQRYITAVAGAGCGCFLGGVFLAVSIGAGTKDIG
jgi:hypothetical protein